MALNHKVFVIRCDRKKSQIHKKNYKSSLHSHSRLVWPTSSFFLTLVFHISFTGMFSLSCWRCLHQFSCLYSTTYSTDWIFSSFRIVLFDTCILCILVTPRNLIRNFISVACSLFFWLLVSTDISLPYVNIGLHMVL